MSEMSMECFSMSDVIQTIGILVSLLIGVSSIIVAVLSLRQNSKMIKESTRPYIVVYFETITIKSTYGLFVVKNFGQTGATIKQFNYDDSFLPPKKDSVYLIEQLDNVTGVYLAPNQSMRLTFPLQEIPEGILHFAIEYRSRKTSYKDSFEINARNKGRVAYLRQEPQNKELKEIVHALQELAERNL